MWDKLNVCPEEFRCVLMIRLEENKVFNARMNIAKTLPKCKTISMQVSNYFSYGSHKPKTTMR